MIKYLIFCVVLYSFSICISCMSSQISQTNVFEKELREFKYSLYKDVQDLDFYELQKLIENGFKNHIISKKYKDFYNNYRKEIKAYQQAYLEKYKNMELDLQLIKEHEEINSYLEEGPLSVTDFFLNIENTQLDKDEIQDRMIIFKLMYIIPLHRAQSVITQIISSHSSADGLATNNLKSLIVWPLIRTTELKSEYWEIIIDDYDWIYFFDFDLKEDVLYLKKVCTR